MGLGNPGAQYAGTRHNAGFQALDRFAAEERFAFRPGRGQFDAARWENGEARVLLAKPTTYMNLSGRAGIELLDLTGLTPQDALVVVDDIELPLGGIRIRRSGSSGGHRGLDSLIELWGTREFPRLRLGVGRPVAGTVDHVLGEYAEEELDSLEEMLNAAARAIRDVVSSGLSKAMDQFNAKN